MNFFSAANWNLFKFLFYGSVLILKYFVKNWNKVLNFDCLSAVGWVGIVGYGWPRGLWPSEASVLSRHRCHPDVLFHRQSRQSGEYPREMDARGSSLLSQCADHPRRQQEGPSDGRRHQAGISEDEAGTSAPGRWTSYGRQNRCLWVFGMLSKDQRWSSCSFRDGHTCCAPGQKEEEAKVSPTLNTCLEVAYFFFNCFDRCNVPKSPTWMICKLR